MAYLLLGCLAGVAAAAVTALLGGGVLAAIAAYVLAGVGATFVAAILSARQDGGGGDRSGLA